MDDMHFGARFFVDQLKVRLTGPPRRLLVAGCGAEGKEVVYLAGQIKEAVVIGFDIALKEALHNSEGERWKLLRADVLDIPFEDASFDAVFYYHVIEHVRDPERSLREIARVLKPGGSLFIGTPNRSRLIGYIGAGTSWKNKLAWNWDDRKPLGTILSPAIYAWAYR